MKWHKIISELELYSENELNHHPHCEEEKANLFHTLNLFNSMGSEFEVYNYLNAIVMLFKPINIIETGTQFGVSTLAMASALEFNGQGGKIITIEQNDNMVAKALAKKYELDKYITFITGDTLDFMDAYSGEPFDFALFDSDLPIRSKEFTKLYINNKLSNIIAFHDTSRVRGTSGMDFCEQFILDMDEIGKEFCKFGIENKLSRGFRMFELNK